MLGYETIGAGPLHVIVLNDWLCDTSTWDGARAYFDRDRFSWVFADLRGYGRSRDQRGSYTLLEAAADVLELADALSWQRFALVGHSMSTLITLHLAQQAPERITRAVVLTPAPPTGFGADDATLAVLQAMAADDEKRLRFLRRTWGDRLNESWIQLKAARWRERSEVEAVVGYVAMFASNGLPNPTAKITIPVLAVTGEQDGEAMRSAAVTSLLSPLCTRLTVMPLAQCGHYPMQEAPPLLATLLERFLIATP